MYDRPGKFQMTARTQVIDFLRELETIKARKANAMLLRHRVVVPTSRVEVQRYNIVKRDRRRARRRGSVHSSWLARAAVIGLFLVVAAACGAVIPG